MALLKLGREGLAVGRADSDMMMGGRSSNPLGFGVLLKCLTSIVVNCVCSVVWSCVVLWEEGG